MSSTSNQEGPNVAPPSVPEGWIAQWDGQGKRYYYVQLTTRVSQWEVPTQPAPGMLTPGQTPVGTDHPYGKPESQSQSGQGEIIMDAEGRQSIRYPDGSVYPHNGSGDGERGIGSFAMQTLLNGGKNKYGSNNNQSSSGGSGLTGLAGQFLSGSHSSNTGTGSSGAGGIVGALAGGLLGGGKKPNSQPQTNYSGNPPQQQSSGFMGGMFGGHSNSSQGNNYGYSNGNASAGGYTGEAPPTSYQPGNQSAYGQPQHQSNPQQSYNAPQTQQPPSQYGGGAPSYGGASAPYGGQEYGVAHNPNYSGAVPGQNQYPPQAPPAYGAPQHVNSGHGNMPPPHPQHQNSFGAGNDYGSGRPPGLPNQYPPHQPHHPHPQQHPGAYPPQAGYNSPGGWEGPPKPVYDQGQYGGGPPPIPSGSHPNNGGNGMEGGGYPGQGYPGQGYPGQGQQHHPQRW